jgi:hypothetical protein
MYFAYLLFIHVLEREGGVERRSLVAYVCPRGTEDQVCSVYIEPVLQLFLN